MLLTEGNLSFDFQANTDVCKYDDWSFYRNQFANVTGGTKAVDFICIDKQDSVTWLIEVKDYRHPESEKITVGELVGAVAIKVRDTLAGLVAAKDNANQPDEKDFAAQALTTGNFKVVLHVEMPPKNKMIQLDMADLATKLKQQIKAIDAHPKVVNQAKLINSMRWTVTG